MVKPKTKKFKSDEAKVDYIYNKLGAVIKGYKTRRVFRQSKLIR